jgi:multiple sugar transport system permease protein
MTVYRRWSLGRALAAVMLITVLVTCTLPLWFAFKTALLHPSVVFEYSASLMLFEPTLLNFKRVLGMLSPEQSLALGGSGAEMNFIRAFRNSVIFTTVVVVLQVGFAAMAAYAFARLHFPGKKLLFALFLGTMMVPGVVTFIPNFVLMKELGLLNTMAGMVAPFCLMQGFSIFFLRQFFLSIPKELEEAATIDGASHWTIDGHKRLE